MMTSFDYFAPKTIRSAFDLLEYFGAGARVLAGGTDLLVRIRSGRVEPTVVIDLKGISELCARVEILDVGVEIGALTTMAELQHHPTIGRYFPALMEAASSVGSVQIRNRATLAGNICNASPAADTAPALLIYEARVKITGGKHTRTAPLDAFIVGPGKTSLRPGELVESILIPIPAEPQAAAFDRLTRRKGVDLATINVCCQVFASGITRFAVGAAGPVPFVVTDTSGALASRQSDQETRRRVIQALMRQASPISDVRASQDYRQAMLTVLAERTLNKALANLSSQTG